jgi:transposase-like protein
MAASARRRVFEPSSKRSKESARSLAARYGLNPKTVRKWRRRTTTADARMGPKAPKSTVLTPAEEAIVVALRQKTLLPPIPLEATVVECAGGAHHKGELPRH